MKIETVKTSDFEMDFFRFGNPENPKAVVISGVSLKSIMLSADLIESACKKLGEKFEVYFFDRKKTFLSKASIYEMAEDTTKAIKILGLSDINLVGVSQGGMISECIAIKNPQLVKKLALVSTACFIDENARKIFKDWTDFSDKKAAEKLGQSFGKSVYTQPFFEKYKEAIFAGCNGTDEEFKKFSIMVSAMEGFDVQSELTKIKCQTLVIAGQEDKIFSAESSRLMAEKIGCKFLLFKNFGHALYDEAPEYIEKLFQFLCE